MLKQQHNPYTGKDSAGYRFQFRVRTISSSSLYLPVEMKQLPQIRSLLLGESPLTVFNTNNIHDARREFNRLRYYFDFPYWAMKEYRIHDLWDADDIHTLGLNSFQHYIIDIFMKRYHDKLSGRYIISKQFGKCGLTTCVQAYILWLQIFKWSKHLNLCSSNEINIFQLKANLIRHLGREVVPNDRSIYIPKADHRCFFNTYRTPDAFRGIDFGYVHMADMEKWYDRDDRFSSRTVCAAVSGVLPFHKAIVVLEGNVPKDRYFGVDRRGRIDYTTLPADCYRHVSRNPYFLNEVVYSFRRGPKAHYLHIDLSSKA